MSTHKYRGQRPDRPSFWACAINRFLVIALLPLALLFALIAGSGIKREIDDARRVWREGEP